MNTKLGPGSDFTVVELKEALRERGLSTNGTKAKLIKRLNKNDPKVWKELVARRSALLATDSPDSEGCVAVGAADGETLVQEKHVELETEKPHAKKKPKKCFKCHKTGHIAAHCRTKKCPKWNQSLTSDAYRDFARVASSNVQPIGMPDPYMIRIKIITETINSGPCSYTVDAIIDSGSPISLVRSDVILIEPRSLEREHLSGSQFYGLGGLWLQIDGVLFGILEVIGVRVKIKFYVVPSETMAYNVLLGRDFLKCSRICVTLGETVRISSIDERAIN